MSTYIERMEARSKVAFQKAASKAGKPVQQVQMSESEKTFAEKTISLAQNPAFNEFLKYITEVRTNLLMKPYEKHPLCKRESLEYVIGFNDGHIQGISFVTREIERIWKSYLFNLENKKGEPNENEKSR